MDWQTIVSLAVIGMLIVVPLALAVIIDLGCPTQHGVPRNARELVWSVLRDAVNDGGEGLLGGGDPSGGGHVSGHG